MSSERPCPRCARQFRVEQRQVGESKYVESERGDAADRLESGGRRVRAHPGRAGIRRIDRGVTGGWLLGAHGRDLRFCDFDHDDHDVSEVVDLLGGHVEHRCAQSRLNIRTHVLRLTVDDIANERTLMARGQTWTPGLVTMEV